MGNIWQKVVYDPIGLEQKWLAKYGPLYGTYFGLSPSLTVAKAELIKQVMIKDFHLFINRRRLHTHHEIFNRNLFNLEDTEWKSVRSITTPTFTSGKLRGMGGMMGDCIDKLDVYLEEVTKEKSQPVLLKAKQMFAGFTIDVIASTTFATQVNSNGADRDNLLVKVCTSIFDIHPVRGLIALSMPLWLNNLLGIKNLLPPAEMNYLLELLKNVVEARIKQGEISHKKTDLVQLLLNASISKKELNNLDYNSLTATAGRGIYFFYSIHFILFLELI